MSAVMTPAEFAAEVSSDGRTVRKFLRATFPKDEHPGKGARWQLPATKRDIAKLRKQFEEWSKHQAEEAEKRAQAKTDDEPEATEEPGDDLELDD